jgi:hypothetical protein
MAPPRATGFSVCVKFVDVGHTTLDQVSDRSPLASTSIACSTSMCAERSRIAMRGNSSRIARAAHSPLLGVRRRHPDVYEDQIRGVRADEVKEFLGVADLTRYGKAGALERARQAPHSSGGKRPCAAA